MYYSYFSKHPQLGTFLLTAGIFNCGADVLLTGSVPVNLGTRDGRDLASGVTAFVNGISIFGGIVGGMCYMLNTFISNITPAAHLFERVSKLCVLRYSLLERSCAFLKATSKAQLTSSGMFRASSMQTQWR